MYLYKTFIFHDTQGVVNTPQGNSADVADFEASYKALCTAVNDIVIAQTTYEISKTYTEFKELIDGTVITWADVKLLTENKQYVLMLDSSNTL